MSTFLEVSVDVKGLGSFVYLSASAALPTFEGGVAMIDKSWSD